MTLLMTALLMPFASCRHDDQRWNLLLVTFDTTRADHLGCYGSSAARTPTLDRLAADGVRFADAMSAVPITAPSHTTILTGRYPLSHGIRDNGLFVLDEQQITLAEILGKAGYATAAAVGSFPVTAQFGLDQGFDLYDDHLTGAFEDFLGERSVPKQRLFFDERRAAQVNEAILPWLGEHADHPFFAWVHYFDPHQPFEPPPPYDQLFADDLYNGEIAYADACLGFLLGRLEQLGVLDHTLVVATADHGEGLGDHNELTHAALAYGSTLHVPLIMRPPRGAAHLPEADVPGTHLPGTVIEQRVGTVDIVPTVLDLLGVEPPAGLQGRSLAPLLSGGEMPEVELYAENLSPHLSHGWGELRVLFDGDLKYIHGPRSELYDLGADPQELHDLSAERADTALRMRSELEAFIQSHAVAGVSAPQELSDDVRQRLEALGYLHSSDSDTREITESLQEGGVAPQDRVGDVNDLSAAKHLLFSGRVGDALQYTEKLVRVAPHSPLYLELHATALAELGRLDEAWAVAERLRSEGPVPEPLVLQLAAHQFEKGEHEQAIELVRSLVESEPKARAAWLLASLYDRTGQPELAVAALDTALAINPAFVPARVDRAVRLAKAGAGPEAEAELLRALEDNPYYAKAHYNYGAYLLRAARLDEATRHFSRAVDLAPRYLKAHLALVATYAAAGNMPQARQAYERLGQLAPRSHEAATAAELLAGQ